MLWRPYHKLNCSFACIDLSHSELRCSKVKCMNVALRVTLSDKFYVNILGGRCLTTPHPGVPHGTWNARFMLGTWVMEPRKENWSGRSATMVLCAVCGWPGTLRDSHLLNMKTLVMQRMLWRAWMGSMSIGPTLDSNGCGGSQLGPVFVYAMIDYCIVAIYRPSVQ